MRASEKDAPVVATDKKKVINSANDLEIQEVQESIITHLAVMTSGVGSDGVQGTYLYNMLKYCFGWGVVDMPPTKHELYSIFNAETIEDKRAIWVQHVVCKTTVEARELMVKIMNYEAPIVKDEEE